MAKWTANDIPDLSGRRAIVTGANSGIGLQTAAELARHGAHVVMACRDQGRGARAVSQVQALAPGATVELGILDLADLSSVQRFADEYAARHQSLDLLVNNAGVMALPYRKTVDGFEMQFGTNHLGHFALTGRLLPLLATQSGARLVTVSSMLHKSGQINFADLQGEHGYKPRAAYAQSKLANLLFAFELQRRIGAAGAGMISVAAHPGYAATNLQAAGPAMAGRRMELVLYRILNRVLAQSDAQGALPSLYAATAPDVKGGAFYGPDGLGGMRGHPVRVKAAKQAYSKQTALRLWQVSEELTGVRYELPEGAQTK